MESKEWIDILKGIGILSVVAEHIFTGFFHQIIFLFHMPLFFFLGGYLFRKRDNLWEYFWTKAKHLLIPYTVFLILLYFPIFFPDKSNITLQGFAEYLIKSVIGGKLLVRHVGVFWFVTYFFLVQQIFNYIINKFQIKTINWIVLIMLILSYINSLVFPDFWLPWNANVVFAALPVFYIGYRYKEGNFQTSFFVLIALSIIVIASSIYLQNNTYVMKVAFYGIPLFTLASGLILILIIVQIFKILSPYKYIALPFEKIGQASMIIMFLHQPIQLYIAHKFSENGILRFIIAIALSYLLYVLCRQFTITRSLFLGSKKDFNKVFNRFQKSRYV